MTFQKGPRLPGWPPPAHPARGNCFECGAIARGWRWLKSSHEFGAGWFLACDIHLRARGVPEAFRCYNASGETGKGGLLC